MTENINVSVIIPVYGVEKYIEKCVVSLFEQTIQEGIEFIFIDDCTPDESINIIHKVLENYPYRKNQVNIIHHKMNLGIAETRYTGLVAARGEYVISCDSDDWVHKDMYRLLYEEAKRTDADIVGCDVYHVYSNRIEVHKENFSLDQNKIVEKIILGKEIGGYLWNRLVRRDFYLEGSYRAKQGITLWDDMAITIPMHISTNKVAYVPRPLYFYRRTDNNTLSTVLSDRNIKSALEVANELNTLPLKLNWKHALDSRTQDLLFYRVLTISGRNPNGWRNIELPFILYNGIRLSFCNNISKVLLSHRLDTLQKAFTYVYKIFQPSIWKKILK